MARKRFENSLELKVQPSLDTASSNSVILGPKADLNLYFKNPTGDEYMLLSTKDRRDSVREEGQTDNSIVTETGIRNALYNYWKVGTKRIRYGLLYNGYAAFDVRKITSSDDWEIPYLGDEPMVGNYPSGYSIGFGKLMKYLDPNATYHTPIPTTVCKDVRAKGLEYWTVNDGLDTVKLNIRGSSMRHHDGLYGNIQVIFLAWSSNKRIEPNRGHILSFTNIGNSFSTYVSGDYKIGASIILVKENTTLQHGEEGVYIGNDGHVYKTVCVGTQEWLVEPLVETQYRNGDFIPFAGANGEYFTNTEWENLSTGACCAHSNDYGNAFYLDSLNVYSKQSVLLTDTPSVKFNISYINDSIEVSANAVGFEGAVQNSHTHTNKVILDSITQNSIDRWDNAVFLMHEHSNLTALDSITSAHISNWNTAVNLAHGHSNLSVLDGITQQMVDNWQTGWMYAHGHSNLSVLDSISQTAINQWNFAVTYTHNHINKSILDSINQGAIDTWDEAYNWGDHAIQGYLTYLPIASASVLGGIKVGSGLSIDGNGVLSASGGGGGSGTVTSVGLSMPNIFSVSNSPITTNGTFSVSLVSQTKNKFLGSPAASTGTPSFRTLVAADIPTLPYDNYEAWYCNGASIFSKNASLGQGQYNGVDFVEGTGVTINSQSSPDGSKLRLTFSASGGGGGSTINFYNETNNGTVNLTSGSWVDVCTHTPSTIGEFMLMAHATFNKNTTTAAVLGLRIVSIINGITNVVAATEQYVPSVSTNRNNLAITGFYITKGSYSPHEFKLQAYASITGWTVVGVTPSTSQGSGIEMNVLHKVS